MTFAIFDQARCEKFSGRALIPESNEVRTMNEEVWEFRFFLLPSSF